MRVLIVEDEPISARVLSAIMMPFGRVEQAANGMEAVEAYEQSLTDSEPFDLVLLDIMMPELNGQEALAEIRAIEEERGIEQGSAVRVIMTTALDDAKNLYQAHACGCVDYLVKPIDRTRLMKALNRMGLCLPDA